jgi:hypothetical protein
MNTYSQLGRSALSPGLLQVQESVCTRSMDIQTELQALYLENNCFAERVAVAEQPTNFKQLGPPGTNLLHNINVIPQHIDGWCSDVLGTNRRVHGLSEDQYLHPNKSEPTDSDAH